MEIDFKIWAELITRWVHVIAGIMWVGQTILFHWMERVLVPPAEDHPDKSNIAGELWMVHGGGFYLVEKQKWPRIMPQTLNWFKWEAMSTWLSGMMLLMLIYWTGAPLLDYGSELSRPAAIGISIGVLVGGRLVYDLIWNWSPIRENLLVGGAISWALVVALTYWLGTVFSDRAAFLHIGAMFGTIMVSSVWMIIIPNQHKMIKIAKEDGEPQPELGAQSKRCSIHNTYMSVPLIFTMLSTHYPETTYGSEHGWAVMGVLLLVGFGGAKLIREKL